MLADLQLVRKHLETANTRNHTLYEQLNVARDTLVTCDTERLDWRKQCVCSMFERHARVGRRA